ncbi:hypothetical protein [uncultured Chryseobacterium sp.]|uniref:phage tail protein n=1 Tax=uncultured Chryseobacterium sp. TaxID=259322 RepID=UPI0025875C6A|nr:hypothetical protein [uncultured Chryseobacterium sp.]
MKAAKPVEKDNKNHHSQSKKQKAKKPVVVPLPVAEVAPLQTQKPEESAALAGFATPNINKTNASGIVAPVHGSQTIYDQGSEIMFKKHQESMAETGDINHPDTQKAEKDYISTLNISQVKDYHDLKSGTSLPKTLEEQAAAHQQNKKSPETNAETKSPEKKQISDKGDIVSTDQLQPVNPDKAPVEEIDPAPSANAHSNSAFTELSGKISSTAKLQKQHEPSHKATNDAQAAAPSPANERQSMAQASQINVMGAKEAGMFKKEDFKALLSAKIHSIQLPKNEEQADEFEKHNNINEVNQKAVGDVKREKNAAANDIASATAAKPDIAAQPHRPVAKMPTQNVGKAPSTPNVAKAMPVKRTAASVEQPMKQQTASIDSEMKANGVTDKMLATSNEPSFTDALDQKNNAKAQSVEATHQFRDNEAKELSKTRSDAQAQAVNHISGMHGARKGGLGNVHGDQQQTSAKDSQKRKEIADHINGIYVSSKADVDVILNNLDTTVAKKFDEGSRESKKAFEAHVDREMKAYKKKRYGDAYADYGALAAAGKWIWDKLTGLPEEVNKFFDSGKDLYIKVMDKFIDQIASHVTTQLNAAKTRIAKGKKDVQTYVDSLSPSLRKIGKEAIAEIQSKFNALEESVNSKKDALIDVLAKKYADNIASIDTRIADLKAQNSGLINKALDVLKTSVFAIIIEIKNTLTNLLSGVISAIQAIIMDPIGFFKNLIAGVSQGFTNFGTNIWTHLKTGFFGWLTGAMKGISFTMPEDVFSLKGIFSITTQVLGLTWDGIRNIGARVIGEPVMKVLETASEKGLEIIPIVRKDGAAGLWEYLKDQFADLKATVMDAMMDIIQTQVIQAGIKWVMGLMTPVGAFIKAAMAIIDMVKFFIQRAAQIMELVKSFTDSIKAIASGNVSAVAKSIENALGRAVPVLIGFLASLLGIGGLADKILGVIRKIRQRIENAIVKFWNFIKGKAKGLLGKFMGKSKKDNIHEPEKQKKIDAGFIYLKEEEKKADENHNNKLTLEQANKAAKKTKAKYPVFSSLKAESKDEKIIYRYTASPENVHETGTELENTEKVDGHLLDHTSADKKTDLTITEERQGKQRLGYKAILPNSKSKNADGIIVGDTENAYVKKRKEKNDFDKKYKELLPLTPEERRKKITAGGDEHDKFKPIIRKTVINGDKTTITYGYKDGSETFIVTYDNKTNETEKVIADNISFHKFGRGKTQGETVEGLNRAHILANEVRGTGYVEGHNLMLTSDTFNKVTMREQEENIGKYLDLEGEFREGVLNFNMTVDVLRFENNENSTGSIVRKGLLKRKNQLGNKVDDIPDEKRATSERYKEYMTLEALLNMSDTELLKTIGAGANAKGVRRVKNVMYKITKVTFGNNKETTPNKEFETGPDHFLGTK